MSFFCFVIAFCICFFLSQQQCNSFRVQPFRKQCSYHLAMSKKDINMPALSSTMKEGKIVSWNKKIGDKVSAGDVLLVVESDKADMDVESFEDGYLAAIFTAEGESAMVGSVVATIVDSPSEIVVTDHEKELLLKASVNNSPTKESKDVPVISKPKFESILMPSLSSTMKEGKIVNWNKKVGDKISPGDMLLVVESDKADMDVEAYEDGYLAAILVSDGEIASVGAPVAYLVKSLDDVEKVQLFLSPGESSPNVQPVAKPQPEENNKSDNTFSPTYSHSEKDSTIIHPGRIASSGYAKTVAKNLGIDLRLVPASRPDQFITSKDVVTSQSTYQYARTEGLISATPVARKLAAELKVNLSTISGSGNFGRIIPDDVLRVAGKITSQAPSSSLPKADTVAIPPNIPSSSSAKQSLISDVVPMTGMQKAVAKNMEKSLSAPVFRVSRDIITDNFDLLYAKLKPKGVSVSALLAKAVAQVCQKHPIMNAAYGENGNIIYHKDVNVAMAVAMDGGLLTPTIMQTQEKDVFTIARTWKDLVDRAKAKKLSPAEYSSGTITISNMGMMGVSSFDAILPPGTGAIIAIAASQPRVVQLPNGYFSVQKAMTVTVTSDHRHIYGAHVAEFLKDLAELLENSVDSLLIG